MSRRLLLWPLGAFVALAIAGWRPAPPVPEPPPRLVHPLPGAAMTQPFGCTTFELEPWDPACAGGHVHTGIDLAAAAGTPVRAAAAGDAVVTDSEDGYGLHVLLEHGGRLATLYAHLESTALRTGDRIGAGQEVGRLGSSGLSTGPHLHFEVRRDGRPVDPAPWLPAGS